MCLIKEECEKLKFGNKFDDYAELQQALLERVKKDEAQQVRLYFWERVRKARVTLKHGVTL